MYKAFVHKKYIASEFIGFANFLHTTHEQEILISHIMMSLEQKVKCITSFKIKHFSKWPNNWQFNFGSLTEIKWYPHYMSTYMFDFSLSKHWKSYFLHLGLDKMLQRHNQAQIHLIFKQCNLLLWVNTHVYECTCKGHVRAWPRVHVFNLAFKKIMFYFDINSHKLKMKNSTKSLHVFFIKNY